MRKKYLILLFFILSFISILLIVLININIFNPKDFKIELVEMVTKPLSNYKLEDIQKDFEIMEFDKNKIKKICKNKNNYTEKIIIIKFQNDGSMKRLEETKVYCIFKYFFSFKEKNKIIIEEALESIKYQPFKEGESIKFNEGYYMIVDNSIFEKVDDASLIMKSRFIGFGSYYILDSNNKKKKSGYILINRPVKEIISKYNL